MQLISGTGNHSEALHRRRSRLGPWKFCHVHGHKDQLVLVGQGNLQQQGNRQNKALSAQYKHDWLVEIAFML
jgi:hypothetical protein